MSHLSSAQPAGDPAQTAEVTVFATRMVIRAPGKRSETLYSSIDMVAGKLSPSSSSVKNVSAIIMAKSLALKQV